MGVFIIALVLGLNHFCKANKKHDKYLFSK